MQKIYKQLVKQLENGYDVVLVSVMDSSGSVPRGAGARMLVAVEGRIGGTIGGGAVEFKSIGMAQKFIERRIKRETSSESSICFTIPLQDLGMVCGGDMTVRFDFFPAHDTEAIAQAEKLYHESLTGTGRVFIFGGGHVAQALVPALATVDFWCVVLEDREDFCRPELFPLAEETRLITQDPEGRRFDISIDIGAEDYVVIITRGHKDDQAVLSQTLKTPARYIGMIGSRSKSSRVFANLREQGFSEDDLKRVTTPIGLPIKAETPEEIAVSITAQLILERAVEK